MLDKILDRLRLVDASSQADADKSLRPMSGPARARPGAALLARCQPPRRSSGASRRCSTTCAPAGACSTPWT